MSLEKMKKGFEYMVGALDAISGKRIDEALVLLDAAEAELPQIVLASILKAEIESSRGDFFKAHDHYLTAIRTLGDMERNMGMVAGNLIMPHENDYACLDYMRALERGGYPAEVGIISSQMFARHMDYFGGYIEDAMSQSGRWFELHMHILQAHGFRLPGSRVLEIGGSIIPVVCMMYACCHAKAETIDKYRTPSSTDRIAAAAQMICHRLVFEKIHRTLFEFGGDKWPRTAVDDIVRFENGKVCFQPSRLHYHEGVDSADMPFEADSFDLVSSAATLEHVGDPEGDPMDTVREIARVLKPGGWSAHYIDLFDHRFPDSTGRGTRPFDFLCHSEQEWRTMEVDANQRANRWRASRWLDAFASAGFTRVEVLKNHSDRISFPRLSDEMFGTFHPDFRKLDRDDLETLEIVIIHRKK